MSLKILEFQTEYNKYIFDGVTGSVLAVDDILIDCIKLYETIRDIDMLVSELKKKYDEEYKIKAAIMFVKKYSEKGAFYVVDKNEKNNWMQGTKFNNKIILDILEAGYTQQLILNVTEDCNMRCKYCFLSETYKFTRNRTNRMMSEDTAIKALNFFFEFMSKISKFNPGKTCAITFYGGEALLNFKVIKKSIEYAKKNCPVMPTFNITTNGVLLSGEIVDYLVENEVAITVSLDGCKEEHDRNRVDARQKGTFDTIIRNVEELKRKYPDYNKINLGCVYDCNTDLKKIDDFFEENPKLPFVGTVSAVVDNGTDYYNKFSEEQKEKFLKKYSMLLSKYMNKKIRSEKMSSYLELLFEMQLINVLFKVCGEDRKLPILPFTCSCIPGMKISVRPDGTIDMCEKINGTMPIGNIKNGLDINAISKIIKDFNSVVTSNCYLCPINRSCGVCFAQTCEDGKFCKQNCDNILNFFKTNLSIAYSVLEQNHHAYDEFLYREEWLLIS